MPRSPTPWSPLCHQQFPVSLLSHAKTSGRHNGQGEGTSRHSCALVHTLDTPVRTSSPVTVSAMQCANLLYCRHLQEIPIYGERPRYPMACSLPYRLDARRWDSESTL